MSNRPRPTNHICLLQANNGPDLLTLYLYSRLITVNSFSVTNLGQIVLGIAVAKVPGVRNTVQSSFHTFLSVHLRPSAIESRAINVKTILLIIIVFDLLVKYFCNFLSALLAQVDLAG